MDYTLQGRVVKRETIEMSMRMVNEYKYHCKETGFHQWKQNTPDHIKELSIAINEAVLNSK